MALPRLPETPAALRAAAVCRRFSSTALVSHSYRSFHWAAAYAADRDLPYDRDLLFVAAMVHDLGLSRTFDAHETPFEVVGGELGWVMATALGWSAEQAERVSEVCILHMRADVRASVDVEAHLLQVGTSADVSGLRALEFPESFRDALLSSYPRTGFVEEFVAAFEAEAARKPACATAGLLASDWPRRMQANPLPR